MKKFFLALIITIVLFCLSGCSNRETETTTSTSPTESISETDIGKNDKTKLHYLNKNWDEFSYMNPVRNSAIYTLRQLGLYSEGCEHFRSNLNDKKSSYFTIHDDKIVAYWDMNNPGKMNIKDFISLKYNHLKDIEPQIIYDTESPISCGVYWETDEGNLAITAVNNTYPKENYLEYTVISYAEYNKTFTYNFDFSGNTHYPENLITYLKTFDFPIEGLTFDGTLEYKGVLFDIYSFVKYQNRCLLVELEYPYRILATNNLADAYDNKEIKEVWRNNKDVLYKKARELHQQDPNTYRNIGDLQPETEDILEFDNQYYQTYVDIYKDIRYIYLTEDDGFNAVGWEGIGSRTIFSLDGLQQNYNESDVNADYDLNVEKVVIADGGLRMRNSPSEDGEKISVIPNGSLVLIENIANNWAYITYDGVSGWCSCDYLFEPSEYDDEPLYSAQVNTTEGLHIRSSAIVDPENIITVIPYNSIVEVYIINGDWAFVSYNHIFGYCSNEYLSY